MIILLFVFSAFGELKYIEINSIQNAPIVEVKTVGDFESIISKNKISTAYLYKESDLLLVISENTYFSFPMNGYFSLFDYKRGNSLNYKNGTDYNEAKNFTLNDNSEIYYFYKRNDFKSPADCRDAYKNGFCYLSEERKESEIPKKNVKKKSDAVSTNKELLEEFSDKMSRSNATLWRGVMATIGQPLETEAEAYYKAKELGYKKYDDYKEYLDITGKGFKSKKDMQLAKEEGFLDSDKPLNYWAAAQDFYTANENGFITKDEYVNAKNLNLVTYSDWTKYKQITNFCDKIAKNQNTDRGFALLYYEIQSMQKSEMSLSILSKTLQENFDSSYSENLSATLKKYANVKSQERPVNHKKATVPMDRAALTKNDESKTIKTPFRLNLFDAKVLESFFSSVDISQIGSYDEKTEIFRRK